MGLKEENKLWEDGSFIQSMAPDEAKEKMKTFHKKHDEDMNFNCRDCNKQISAHNKDWHDGMCDECFNQEHYKITPEIQKNQKLFQEFEKVIDKKYSHMADSMLFLSQDFAEYFFDTNTEIKNFTKKDIKKVFKDYLDFVDLNEAESSMLFQTLIDFSDFCGNKGIKLDFFKEHLIKNKEKILDYWMEECEDFEDNPWNDISPNEFINNFDVYYNMMRLQKGKKKVEKADVKEVIDFLEKTHKLMKNTFEKSLEIRKNNPELSDEEYLSKIDEAVNKEYGEELFAKTPNPDDITKLVFSLPKEQAKKFFQLTFQLEEISKFKFGTIKRKDLIEGILGKLEDLKEDIKRNKNEIK